MRSIIVWATALVILACDGGSPYAVTMSPPSPPPPMGGGNTINATPGLALSPSSVTITAGESVTWAFGSVGHNVYFDAAAGAPADIPGTNSDVSISRTFSTQGTFGFSCHIHPNMRGQVIVQ